MGPEGAKRLERINKAVLETLALHDASPTEVALVFCEIMAFILDKANAQGRDPNQMIKEFGEAIKVRLTQRQAEERRSH